MSHRRLLQPYVIDFGDRTAPIIVDYKDAKKYYKTNSYEGRPGSNWIEFCVHHEGVLNFTTNPHELIINALFDAVDGEKFIPVNYSPGNQADIFLARSCQPALNKLFERRLSIKIITGNELNMTVYFNAAVYNFNQIMPEVIISQVIDRQMDCLENYQGVPGILNLSNFKANRYFKNIVVRLSNLATLKLVCKTIYNNDDRRRSLNGFSFAHNQISDLAPLKLFGDVDYGLLDLSNNRLSSAVRLAADLERFRAKELNLANNPITKLAKYPDCLGPLKSNFKIIDKVPVDKLYKMYTPLNYEIDVECDGTRIDWSCLFSLTQFKDSQDWHAILIPDPEQEFQQAELFDFFFVCVSATLSEFYPCYYKYEGGEHRFLVRNCFDQIEHLAQNLGLILKIPQSVLVGEEQQINFDRFIPYYMRMDVSKFKQGHVQPTQCIELAIQKRFNVTNRVLNLEQFQRTDGLEHVHIQMSSPKILNSILRMASRKFLGNCVELRLGGNKIVTLNNLRTLSLMTSLHALDLGHNWIRELSELSSLGDVPLKSLRLHGNPVCRKYSLPSEYVKAVKDIFPTLLTLDDVDLSRKPGLMPQKNFLCNISAYELMGELFLYPYLRDFEQLDDRINLRKFYTDTSIFTLTSSYDMTRSAKTSNELFKRISKYNYHSRNLLKNPWDTCRLNIGAADIMEVLMQLPVVKHDYISLHTDVMHYDDQMVVMSVTGLLHDEPNLPLAFSRQFVLKVDETNLGVGKCARRMKIINEHFSIMNPTKKQERDAFKFTVLPELNDAAEDDQSVDVKEHKLHLFQELTGLRPRWCTRIVQEEANWNFHHALQQFMAMEEAHELPDDAYA